MIITIYHGRIQHFCFLLAHDIVERLKLKHIQVALLLSSREFSMDYQSIIPDF
jgi:hypothetical protein